MKKIKLFGILTFLLMVIAVPQNEMLKVDAASNDTELLSYVYDLFADENIVEYDDINYFMSLPDGVLGYEIHSPLNPNYGDDIGAGTYQNEYYYSHDEDGWNNYNVIDDLLFNNFWFMSESRLALNDTFTLSPSYGDDISEFEWAYRNFDFCANTQTYNQFYLEQNTSGSSLTKEQLLCNPGIVYEGKITGDDGYEYSQFRKASWASLGGVSLLQNTMYLNTSFDETLKENNNLEICLIDTMESGYDMDDFVEYNQVLAAFFEKGTFYNYPLIKVNGKPIVYVVFEGTGGDTNSNFLPHIVCINSKFRMEYALDNFGMYLSLPYYEYIETISYALPYYVSSYCWDVDKHYSDESFDSFYDNNILLEAANFLSLNPYWWNDDTLEKVKGHVDYHPVSISDIDNDTDQVTLKVFTSQCMTTYINELFVADFTLKDIDDGSSYMVDIESTPVDVIYDGGAYMYAIYDIMRGMPTPGQSRTYENVSINFYDEYPLFRVYDSSNDDYEIYYINDPTIYNKTTNPYGKRINFAKNRTKQQVCLDDFIYKDNLFLCLTFRPISYTSIYFSFYDSEKFINKIDYIDEVNISLYYGDGQKGNFRIKSSYVFDTWQSLNGNKYYYYKLGSWCNYADYEYFYSMNPGNLFSSGFSFNAPYIYKDKISQYDFELTHILDEYKYRKCDYSSVINATCNYWIGKDTYVIGGFGKNAYSAEYDELGNFIGITDINGNIVPGWSLDDTGIIVDEKGNPVVDDTKKESYSYTYVGKNLDNLFDSMFGGSDNNFDSNDISKILSIIGILTLVVLVIKFYPSIKKWFNKSKKNKKKRN